MSNVETFPNPFTPAVLIEMKAERLIRKLDREFLSGNVKMSSWDYEERLRNIDRWCAINIKRTSDPKWSR